MATPQLGSNLGEGVHKVVSVCMFKATLVLLLAIAVAAVVFLMADTDQTNTTLKTPKPVEGLPKKLRAIVIGGTGEIGRARHFFAIYLTIERVICSDEAIISVAWGANLALL